MRLCRFLPLQAAGYTGLWGVGSPNECPGSLFQADPERFMAEKTAMLHSKLRPGPFKCRWNMISTGYYQQ